MNYLHPENSVSRGVGEGGPDNIIFNWTSTYFTDGPASFLRDVVRPKWSVIRFLRKPTVNCDFSGGIRLRPSFNTRGRAISTLGLSKFMAK